MLGGCIKMSKNRKNMFAIVCVSLFVLGFLLLVSAQSVVSDTDSNTIINSSDGTIFNVTATPHRQKDNNNIGFVTVNISTDKNINKSFTLFDGHENNISLDNNSSCIFNTSVFNITSHVFIKSLTISESNNNSVVNLNVTFNKTDLVSLESVVNPKPYGTTYNINPATLGGIQGAVDNASSGDTISLDGGTYSSNRANVVEIYSKNLTITASGINGSPIIDGQGQRRCICIQSGNYSGATFNCELNGLILTNGYVTSSGPSRSYGGGGLFIKIGSMYYSSGISIVNNCTIYNNTADGGACGGGAFIEYTQMSNCKIFNNSCIGSVDLVNGIGANGGGVNSGSSNISNCLIENNTASGNGGGVNNYMELTDINGNVPNNGSVGSILSNCVLSGNIALRNGGGVNNILGSIVDNCNINNNIVNESSNKYGSTGGNGGGVNNYGRNDSGSGGFYCWGGFSSLCTNCNISNNSVSRNGGGVNNIIGGEIYSCNIIDNHATGYDASGGVNSFQVIDGIGNVSYNRIYQNEGMDFVFAPNIHYSVNSTNHDFNWWGRNNITNLINGSMPDSYYQVELSADGTSTRDVNKSVNGIIPVGLGYRMVLNESNSTGDVGRLPDFNATIKLNNNAGMLRFSPFMMPKPFMSPGDSVNWLAKNNWSDTINRAGNYTFSALVDNQQLNFNITANPSSGGGNDTNSTDDGGNGSDVSGSEDDMNGSDSSGDGLGLGLLGGGLAKAGLPLILLILLSVLGVYYWRRKYKG